MKSKKLLILGLAIVGLGFVVGCNIFSWTHKAGGSDDATALLADGDSALAAGDYAKAMEFYQKAIDADSTSSKARYGYVNAYVKNSGLNIIDFAKNAGNQKTIASLVSGVDSRTSAKAYNLIDDRTKPYGIDMKKFEDLVIAIIDKLDPIAQGNGDGKISKDDPEVNLNLAFAYLIRGIFVIIDPPNGNSGSIQFNIRHNDNGTDDLVDLNGTVISTATQLAQKSTAISYLSTAITRLDTAIANSLAKDASSWTDVRNMLVNVRTTINSYQ